jgi:hypothetical protein
VRVTTVFQFMACWVLLAALCGESAFGFLLLKGLPSQKENHPVARKFIEYNPATFGETKEPLDYFYNELLTIPNAKACIIYYRGRHRSAFQDHVYAKNYLDNRGGIPPERIKAVFGGYREDTAIELWIVPEGAEAPKPTPAYFPKKRRKH